MMKILLCSLNVLILTISPAFAEITMENTEYSGWPNCVRISNGSMELIATTDVGPRILHLAHVGGENLFWESVDQKGKTGGEDWRIYGGHRLWHAPEVKPRTYAPDNEGVQLEWDGEKLTLTQQREEWTAIQKEIEITLMDGANRAKVVHRIGNHNMWRIDLAPWAITVLRGGGYAILPRTPFGEHGENLLPAQTVSLWRYTNMADPRFTWGEKFIRVRTDTELKEAQKIGILNTEGWAAYVLGDEILLKQFEYREDVEYPDMNSNTEVYTSGGMLELETLGPLTSLDRGKTVEWVEYWTLLRDDVPEDDAGIESFFAPYVQMKEGETQ